MTKQDGDLTWKGYLVFAGVLVALYFVGMGGLQVWEWWQQQHPCTTMYQVGETGPYPEYEPTADARV